MIKYRVWIVCVSALFLSAHAPALRAVLVRIGVFTLGASALWALLPIVAS